MQTSQKSEPRLAELVWPARGEGGLLRAAVLALVGTLLLTLSAKVQVPFYPVPMSMQTAVVFLIGIAYGPRLGAATLLLYLAEGAIGLPVFAGTPERGIGLAYMVGPTGGYLLSWVLVAALVGAVAERMPRWPAIMAAVALGTALIYLMGGGWLATMVGVEKALALGVLPFLPGDLVKLLLVTAIAAGGLGTLRRRGTGSSDRA